MRKCFILHLLFLLSNLSYAQVTTAGASVSLSSFALLDIEPDNSTVNLSLPSPSEAGSLDLAVQLNDEKWINYTSSLPLLRSRKVMVQKDYGSIPPGTKLYIIVSNASLSLDRGVLGTGSGKIEIPAVGQKVAINNIGSSFTGSGVNKGHAVSYRLEVTNVSLLTASTGNNIGLTFTIMDN